MRFKTIKLDSNATNIYFTADTHFGHANIIDYTNRPFKSVSEMDEKLIENWNTIIHPTDVVFHLGDFTLFGVESWKYFLSQLNGTKYLIAGNHDKNITPTYFNGVFQILNLLIKDEEIEDGQRITLCHYPMYSWYQSHRGAWHLYGHHHGTLNFSIEKPFPFPTMYDVGVDNNNFFPVSYEEIKAIITKQSLAKGFK